MVSHIYIYIPSLWFGNHSNEVCTNGGIKQCVLVSACVNGCMMGVNGKGAPRNISMYRSMCYMVDSLLT